MDGCVTQAVIDHEQGYLQSRELTDVYTTLEPQVCGRPGRR